MARNHARYTNTSIREASRTFDIGGELAVNPLGFGAMQLTGDGVWGEPRDPYECRRALRCAIELDINLIDRRTPTAPRSPERRIAEALHPYPDDLVIATKGWPARSGPEPVASPTAGRSNLREPARAA